MISSHRSPRGKGSRCRKPAIFISYRGRDAGGHGRALHEYLSGRFGDDRIFFDRSTIESGDKFPDNLRRGVGGAPFCWR